MNDQHLDFIPSDENEQEFTIFEEITEEEAERANEALKDCPEPDYSAVVPPDDEDCVFGFPFEAEPTEDDDNAETASSLEIAGYLYHYEGSMITKEDVAAMIEAHPDWVIDFGDGEYGITESLDSAMRQLVNERMKTLALQITRPPRMIWKMSLVPWTKMMFLPSVKFTWENKMTTSLSIQTPAEQMATRSSPSLTSPQPDQMDLHLFPKTTFPSNFIHFATGTALSAVPVAYPKRKRGDPYLSPKKSTEAKQTPVKNTHRKAKASPALSFPPAYTVVAADLSLRAPGFCVLKVETKDGKPAITSVSTSSLNRKTEKVPHGDLLNGIMQHLQSLIQDEDPKTTFFVREAAFNSRAAQSEIGIFEGVGITNWVLWKFGAQWEQIYPVSVKKLITGSGKADKQQVADSLKGYLGDHEYHSDDESDAAAVGVAWLILHKQIPSLQEEQHERDA